MTRHAILYALFCLAVVMLYLVAIGRSYSPFADGGGRAFAHGPTGPTHK